MQRRDFIRRSSQVALFSGLGLPTAIASNVYEKSPHSIIQDKEPLATQIEKLVPELMKKAKVPGFSIAIVRDGRLNWSKGFGVKDQLTKEAVDEHTVFEAASVSKTVFAYMAMKLFEKKVIDLDEPLVKYSSKRFMEGDSRALTRSQPGMCFRIQAGFKTGAALMNHWQFILIPVQIFFIQEKVISTCNR